MDVPNSYSSIIKKHNMKKILMILFLYICFGKPAFGQLYPGQIDSSAIPKLNMHFQSEYSSDITVDTLSWLRQEPGLHVSFGSTDKLYFKNEVPPIQFETHSWEGTGWKGERLNIVILVWSPDTINQVRFTLNDLVNNESNIISRNNLKLNMVSYVLSNYPYGAKDITCGDSPYKDVYLMPDRFETFKRFDLPGRTVRPIWLSIEIPSETKPGIYQGIIVVGSAAHNSVLNLNVKVQNLLLPKPYEWKFRLDLWQNPWVTARYYNIEPWSNEHKLILEKHLKIYADAGGKFITTYAVHSPWADVTYRVDEAMIEWIKDNYGSWRFDYSIFDQYIELAIEAGIDKAITIYTPIPWGNRFRYLDEKTGDYIYEVWDPGSNEFKTFWNFFLNDLKKHLEGKGWFEKTYLGINENTLEQTIAAIKVIKEHSNKWKITYAGDWHTELDSLLDDYSSIFGVEPSLAEVKNRSVKGYTSTYYICCTPPKPNTFVFSPPAEARWLGWYTAAYGYDGMLRWAYDSWPADPVRDARHVYWAAGDCFMIYPGANSSIRFEKLREGIVDFEKIRILRDMSEKTSDKNVKDLMKQLNEHLNSITIKGNFGEDYFTNSLNDGKKILEELSEKVSGSN